MLAEAVFANNKSQTLRQAYHIMNETKYGERRYDVGIDQMLKNQIFESVYPLHSVSSPLVFSATYCRFVSESIK